MYIVFIFLLPSCFALELPSYFPKCCLDDPLINECILKSAMELKPLIKHGVKEIQIPSLYRIITPNFVISHLTKNASFENNVKNFTFYGMDEYEIENFIFDPNKIVLQGKLVFKELFTHAYYLIEKGSILDIPIVGSGIFGGIIGPLNVTFDIRGSLVKKQQVEYAKVDSVKVQVEIEQYDIGFQGLKYENGPWGNTNKIFRGNTKLVAETLTPAFREMFRIFSTNYLEWFLNEIPYNVLFPC